MKQNVILTVTAARKVEQLGLGGGVMSGKWGASQDRCVYLKGRAEEKDGLRARTQWFILRNWG